MSTQVAYVASGIPQLCSENCDNASTLVDFPSETQILLAKEGGMQAAFKVIWCDLVCSCSGKNIGK